MKYGKLINGQLEIVKSSIETPMGVLSFSKEVMIKKGAKLIIDNPLNYDKETQILEIVGYTELKEEIIIDYTIKDKNPPLTNEERIMFLENENLHLTVATFDLDFRVFEIECVIEEAKPITMNYINKKEDINMTQYLMAKKIILAGAYERSDMEYKLTRYKDKGVITQAQYDELIALMDADELIK